MKYRHILYLFFAMLAAGSAGAEEMNISALEDVDFRGSGEEETAYDKKGELFSGAVMRPDAEGRKIVYFYRSGKKHGVAVSRFEDGKMELEITYRKGVKDGEEILFYENGNPKYKKTYKQNILDGEEVLFYENGKPQKQSMYAGGILNGEVNYFDQNGERTKIEHYKNGVKDGLEHIIADNILREENHYENGILNGISKKYNAKYLTDEMTYVNGVKEGVHKTYLENGSRTEIPYKNNQKSGIGLAYYPNGVLANRAVYLHDMKNGLSEKFYQNGTRSTVENYKNDKLDGIGRTFNQNGELVSVSYNVDGVELARTDIAKDRELNDIYEAYKEGKLNKFSARKNLWYPILWLGINTEKTDMIEAVEKEMKMYAQAPDDTNVYKKESKTQYADYNRRLFFGLTPLSYAVNLSAPTEILQKFATGARNIEEQNARGTTALLEAVRLNNWDMTKYLLLQKADVSQKYDGDNTILLYAVKENARIEIIEELLKAGVDVNARDNRGNSALILAIGRQDAELVSLLAEHHADLQGETPDGKTMLFYAYENKAPDAIIAEMLRAGADVNKKDGAGNVLLLQALAANDNKMAEALLRSGADVNLTDKENRSAVTYVLHNPADAEVIAQIFSKDIDVKNNVGTEHKPIWKQAYEQNNPELLKIIFEKMGGVESADVNGEIPLYAILADLQKTEMVDLALSFVRQADNKLLWTAVQSRNLPLLQKVVAKGADVNAVDANGDSVLIYMIKNGYEQPYLETVETEKMNMNLLDKDGNDALWLAIAADDVSLAENLLRHGANVNKTRGGDSYLMLLTDKQAEMTKLLLNYKADIAYETADKRTMLMKAVWQLNETLAAYLAEQGVNVKMRDENGNSALLYLAEAAQKYVSIPEDELVEKMRKIAALLTAKGEEINAQNGNGETLLLRLAQIKHPAYAKLAAMLAELGLNTELKDQYGKTAADYMEKNK